jgi:hypothetical protein
MNIVKDEESDLVTDSHHILVMWQSHFSQIFRVHGVSDLRQTEIHTAQPLVPELCSFEVEMATEKVKNHITRF